MTRLTVALVRFYQRRISRWLPPMCRFEPSCSEYACQALIRHGFWRGCGLALRRLARCHPFHPGGCDPVPEPERGRPPKHDDAQLALSAERRRSASTGQDAPRTP